MVGACNWREHQDQISDVHWCEKLSRPHPLQISTVKTAPGVESVKRETETERVERERERKRERETKREREREKERKRKRGK